MKIGYAYVENESKENYLNIQIKSLKHCDKIYFDVGEMSIELYKAIGELKTGDSLVIHRHGVISNWSILDMLNLAKDLIKRGIELESILEGGMDIKTASGTFMFQILLAFAKYQNETIHGLKPVPERLERAYQWAQHLKRTRNAQN